MNPAINDMLSKYDTQTLADHENALKEVMQEIILSGLSRAGFFQKAAFCGGTALRIFYGLNRFSEDLDFSLLDPDPGFSLSSFIPFLIQEVNSYGFDVKIEEKKKSQETAIQSAFLKGNTKEILLSVYGNEKVFLTVPKNELIKVKFEIDTDPPADAIYEFQYRTKPVPYEVCLFDESSLFAGKLHAVLGRAWRNRVKGRDLFDFVFYLSRETPVNMKNLRARLVQTKHLQETEKFDLEVLKSILREKFSEIDFDEAKRDVQIFVENPVSLDLWKKDFFIKLTENLKEK